MGTEESLRSAAPATPKRGDRLDVVPVVADVSVTNVCNAACDFCGFARDKALAGPRRYLDRAEFVRALPILRRRRIRYITFQGGEPLVHPEIVGLVAAASAAGMRCGLITNGWFLPRHAEALAGAGLRRLLISIDSERILEHERNRGLAGLARHIQEGIKRARACGIYPVSACVTVSRLLNIDGLGETLEALGFDSVSFSYPRREPFGNTSLVYSEHSTLLDQTPEELLKALESIKQLKKRFKVLDPSGALAEVGRFIRGERQLVPCVGGRKYFYIDWNLDIWRCEAWPKPLGSVFDLDNIPDQREPCNACMLSCYRHASVLMHGPLAVTDAAQALARGDVRTAVSSLFRRGVALSLYSLAAEELPRAGLRFKRSPAAPNDNRTRTARAAKPDGGPSSADSGVRRG
jgi:MoaA/NifB/PqqE/SkfB family radical SAM enzyme